MKVLDEIINGCKAYDPDAQRYLFNTYAPQMRAICMRYCKNEEQAKDVLQDGFIKVFSKVKKYKGNGSFEGWMKRIFVNTAIDAYNKKRKEALNFGEQVTQQPAEEDDAYVGVEAQDLEKKNFNYDAALASELSKEDILTCLEHIPEHFAVVFKLAVIDGMKHKEVADLLNIDEKTSRSRLSRSRGLLKEAVHQLCIRKFKEHA